MGSRSHSLSSSSGLGAKPWGFVGGQVVEVAAGHGQGAGHLAKGRGEQGDVAQVHGPGDHADQGGGAVARQDAGGGHPQLGAEPLAQLVGHAVWVVAHQLHGLGHGPVQARRRAQGIERGRQVQQLAHRPPQMARPAPHVASMHRVPPEHGQGPFLLLFQVLV